MNKMAIAALACIVIFSASCKKKSDSTTTTPTPTTTTEPKMAFTINNLVDFNVRQFDDTTVILIPSIDFEKGEQERLTIKPTDLPSGVKVSPDSISGIPTFPARFTFRFKFLTSGQYPIKMVATTASGTKKDYTINVNSQTNSDCKGVVTGSYYATRICTPGLINDTNYISSISLLLADDTARQMRLTDNVDFSTFYINMRVDCSNFTFTTIQSSDPYYRYGGGTGRYNFDTVVLNNVITSVLTGATHTCTTTFVKR